MKRLVQTAAACVLGLMLLPNLSPTSPAHAAALQAGKNCHARNYIQGNCKHIPPHKKGTVSTPGPRHSDKPDSVTATAGNDPWELSVNPVSAPSSVKGAVQALNIFVVDAKKDKRFDTLPHPIYLSVDPKYNVCAYDAATDSCTRLKPGKDGRYALTASGIYVLTPKSAHREI